MSSMAKGIEKQRSGWTQRRGQLRREQLMDAVCELLKNGELADISLEDAARVAKIPVASAYHFYKDRDALFAAVAAQFSDKFVDILRKPYPMARIGGWQELVVAAIHRATRYYAAHPAARKLLIDGKTPAEIKLADRLRDRSIGALVENILQEQFELPEFSERAMVFFHAVEIVDLILQLSMIQWRKITPLMERHAGIAALAYLREFLPAKLPRRTALALSSG